jgi:hypothetical protein
MGRCVNVRFCGQVETMETSAFGPKAAGRLTPIATAASRPSWSPRPIAPVPERGPCVSQATGRGCARSGHSLSTNSAMRRRKASSSAAPNEKLFESIDKGEECRFIREQNMVRALKRDKFSIGDRGRDQAGLARRVLHCRHVIQVFVRQFAYSGAQTLSIVFGICCLRGIAAPGAPSKAPLGCVNVERTLSQGTLSQRR